MKSLFFLLCLTISYSLVAQSSFNTGEKLYKNKQYNKAEPYFKSYLEQYPEHKQTQEYLGDIAGINKDWDVALNYFETLLEEDPQSANYHFKYGATLGLKCLEMSKIRAVFYLDDIKEHLLKAAQLDPNHIEVRWALIEMYIQLPGIIGGSEEKAIVYANQLLKISPVDGYLAKGYVAEYNEKPKEAEAFYIKAIEVGGSEHTYEKLTTLYENNNQPKKAIENLEKSLKKFDRNQLNYQIAKVCAQYDLESQRGLIYIDRYIENYGVKDGVPLDWAYLRKAQLFKNVGNYSAAKNWINRALENRPDFKEAIAEKELINLSQY